jgi:hypothetical protein
MKHSYHQVLETSHLARIYAELAVSTLTFDHTFTAFCTFSFMTGHDALS